MIYLVMISVSGTAWAAPIGVMKPSLPSNSGLAQPIPPATPFAPGNGAQDPRDLLSDEDLNEFLSHRRRAEELSDEGDEAGAKEHSDEAEKILQERQQVEI